MKGKVKCTCGWSWNKSDSSAKDMYICHECGRDNSNNMKNGGWLDNYNDSQASAPEGMVGDGFSNVGRNYSPAWGGQFQEGGEIPMAQNGKKKPLYVESENDPRYKAYNDSLSLYNNSIKLKKNMKNYLFETDKSLMGDKRTLLNKALKIGFKDKKELDKYLKSTLLDFQPKWKDFEKFKKEYDLKQVRDNLYSIKDSNVLVDYPDDRTQLIHKIIKPKSILTGISDDTVYLDKNNTNPYQPIKDYKRANQILKDQGIQFKNQKEYENWKKYESGAGNLYKLNPFMDDQETIWHDTYEFFDYSNVNPKQQVIVKPTTTITTTKKPKPDKTKEDKKRDKLIPIQNNLQPEDVKSDFSIDAQLPMIRPDAKIPKSYNVSALRYNMKGPSDYYNYNQEGVDYETAMRAKAASDAYNADVEKRYGPQNEYRTPKSAKDAAERLKQLRSEFNITPNYQMGGNVYPVNYVPQAQNGKNKKKKGKQDLLRDTEDSVNKSLGNPMQKAATAAEQLAGKWYNPKTKQWEENDAVDNFRHPMAGRYTSEAIQDKLYNIPILSQMAGMTGSNALGVAHELSTLFHPKDKRGWYDKIRESGEDIFNNAVGATVGSLPISDKRKTNILTKLSNQNMLPDGVSGKGGDMYIKHAMGGFIPKAQEGETMFKTPSIVENDIDYNDYTYSYSEREPYSSELEFLKTRPDVGGMATEDNHVIINPYSPLTEEEKNYVRELEQARLVMRNGYPRPTFELTPKQKEFYSTVQNGKPYSEDIQDIRETIASRILVGDETAQDITKEQQEYADKLAEALYKSKEYATGMKGMMKSKIGMGNAFGHPAIKRMSQAMPKTGMTPEGIGTHYMNSVDNYAVPELQDLGEEELTLVDPDSRSKEAIRFNSPEEANYFAEHYKEVAPMTNIFGELNSFQGGGSLPGATGNMYARYAQGGDVDFSYPRTKGIPSNGPYAKKTMASAKDGGWLDGYEKAQFGKTLTPKQLELKKQVERNNRKFETKAKWDEHFEKERKKEEAKKWVQGSMEEAYKHPLMSPGYFTPEGVAIGALQGAVKMPGAIADGDGWGIAGNAAMMLPFAKPAAKTLGRVLGTEEGLLSNAYRLNPNAERLNDINKSYRVAGLDALEDFNNTGVVRSGDGSLHTFKFADLKGNFHQIKRPTGFPSFQKGYADMRYAPEEGAVVFETGLPTFKRGEINPVTGNRIRGRHYAHRVIDPETGRVMTEIPGSNINVYGDKPHWWKGYQQLDLPGRNYFEGPLPIIPRNNMIQSPAIDSALKKELIPYISRIGEPSISREEEVFRNVMGHDYRVAKELENTKFLDPDGNLISNPNISQQQFYQGDIPATDRPIQKDGGIIKDDRGQWAHPGEITEIGSNQITMQGVPYDVLGISDTGDTKLMKPGKNYKFKGKKVTEFPMAKNGLRQEQKSLQNLDNLLNFTNYNKPQPGGWLSKYE